MPDQPTCAICGDVRARGDGVSCGTASDGPHGLCGACCTAWLGSLAEDAAKLRSHASEAWVGCPAVCDGRWCDRPITFAALAAATAGTSGGSAAAAAAGAAAGRVWRARVEEVRDALNLRCPCCRAVLDPEPEACTAMACAMCSGHFCFACLERFPTAAAAHSHVPRAHGCDSAFAPQKTVAAAHVALRAAAIAELLNVCRGGARTAEGAGAGAAVAAEAAEDTEGDAGGGSEGEGEGGGSSAAWRSGGELLEALADDLKLLGLPTSVRCLRRVVQAHQKALEARRDAAGRGHGHHHHLHHHGELMHGQPIHGPQPLGPQGPQNAGVIRVNLPAVAGPLGEVRGALHSV